MGLLSRKSTSSSSPLPTEFLEWQVELRRHTMVERNGRPHAGVAPLVTVRAPGTGPGFLSHSLICGLLPHPSKLEQKTEEFREIYETHSPRGARELYDAGIAYYVDYYDDAEQFDAHSITTLLHRDLPVVKALEATRECALVFYVFDLADKSRIGRLRCTQLDCVAELHASGPVYDNVWWHNTLFHGPADEHYVVQFHHRASWNTTFGQLEVPGA